MTTSFGCAEAVHRLWEYLDADLSAQDLTALEDHLSFCLRCCGELAFARELRRTLGASATQEIPGDVLSRLTQFVDTLEVPERRPTHEQ